MDKLYKSQLFKNYLSKGEFTSTPAGIAKCKAVKASFRPRCSGTGGGAQRGEVLIFLSSTVFKIIVHKVNRKQTNFKSLESLQCSPLSPVSRADLSHLLPLLFQSHSLPLLWLCHLTSLSLSFLINSVRIIKTL